MRRKLGVGVTAGFSVVFAILVFFSAATYWNITKLSEAEGWVNHTRQVLEALEATFSLLKDAQNGYRGYHATNDKAFAKPFFTARDRIPQQLKELDALLSDNPAQVQRLADLRPVVGNIVEIYSRGMAVRERDGSEASAEYIRSGVGNDEVNRASEMILEMKQSERELLADRSRDAREQYNLAVLTIVLSVALGSVLIGAVFWLMVRDIRQREESALALRAANETLEQRVQERTAALQDEVAERTRAEEELQKSSRKLEESNRELEQFATVASHDLQEPLRKIQAFSDRLREVSGPLLQGQSQEYLTRIVSSAGRMRTLIDDLLSFSRVTRKGQPFVPTDLGQVANEVVSDLEGRLRDTGGWVDVGPLPTIAADPLQLRQLLQNLIANALKFRKPEEPPHVTVRAELLENVEGITGPACRLTVTDNGVGFEQVYAERIFQMFQRLHGRSQYEGNGIGLAICRKIVERHQGLISAASELGVGTTFTVALPIEPKTLE